MYKILDSTESPKCIKLKYRVITSVTHSIFIVKKRITVNKENNLNRAQIENVRIMYTVC